MRRGICVKCGSNLIYVLPAHGGAGTAKADLHLGGVIQGDSHFMVCRACGYTERYINQDRLHRIEQYGRSLAEAQQIAARGQH